MARTGSAVLFKMLGKGTYDAGTAHPVTLPDPNLLCAYKMSDAVKGATPNLKQLAAGGSLAVHLWGSSMSDDKRALVGQRQMNVLGYSSLVYGEPIASLPARDGE